MASKLLKKKSDAANLALTLQSVPYAEQLCTEMNNFSKQFEQLYLKVQELVAQQKNEEVDYIPLVQDMITLQRGFDKPHAAAAAIVRQVNKPASKAKGKAKAKVKAAA